MGLALGIIVFVTLDFMFALVLKAKDERRWLRYELVSCPLNAGLCLYLIFIVGVPWWADVLLAGYALGQAFGASGAAQALNRKEG